MWNKPLELLEKLFYRFKSNPSIIVILLFVLILTFVVSPIFEIPLNDDWHYSQVVGNFLDNFQLRTGEWSGATLMFQVLWGALFCKMWGFSFSILRISTLFSSVLGLIVFYLLLKKLAVKESYALVGTVFVLLNPIYFDLANTFMTDVHFLSLMIFSMFFYIKGYLEEKNYLLLVGSFFAVLSFFVRQLGIFIPIGMLMQLMLDSRRQFKARKIAYSLILPAIALITYLIYIKTQGFTYAQKTIFINNFRDKFFSFTIIFESMQDFFYIFQYLGLFIFPFIFEAIFLKIKNGKLLFANYKLFVFLKLIWTIFIVFVCFINFSKGKFMPYVGNTMVHFGAYNLPDSLWVLVSIFSAIGSIFLGFIIIEKFDLMSSLKKRDEIFIFFFSIFVFIFIPTVLHWMIIDDYFLPLIILSLIFILKDIQKGFITHLLQKIAFGFCIVIMLIYSIINTEYYHRCNKAIWDCAQNLVNRGVSADDIIVNSSWSGWHTFDKFIRIKRENKKPITYHMMEWLDVINDNAHYEVTGESGRIHLGSSAVLIGKTSFNLPFVKKQRNIYSYKIR